VAGCNLPVGLTLEVSAKQSPAARVELYLGTIECPTCKAIAPPGAPRPLAGRVFYPDLTAVDVQPVGADGMAVFRIEASDDTSLVPIVVGVGLDDAGNTTGVAGLTDVPLLRTRGAWWRIELAASAEIAGTDAPQPDGDRVTLWPKADPSRAPCAAIEHWANGDRERVFLVPQDDPDCDDIDPARECAPYSWRAQQTTATIATASCTTTTHIASDYTCIVGGTPCDELQPQSSLCAPVDPVYCLPDNLCLDTGCTANWPACVGAGLVPAVKCTLPANDTLQPCSTLPAATTATVDLSVLFAGKATTCDQIGLSTFANAVLKIAPTLTLGSATFQTANLASYRASGNPCAFDLSWSGQLPGDASSFHAIDVTISNGQHSLVPLAITPARAACGGGPATMTCTLANLSTGDGVANCAL
jgi:hypothetical protein